MILEIIIALLVVVISIVGYRTLTGIWPGSRMIIQDPPVSSSKVSQSDAKFMFFYTEWCPYSQKAKDPWLSFQQTLKNTPRTYGGKRITFEEIDAEAERGKSALYQIKQYPTFKLQTSDKVYEMLGKPTVASFRAFLISALGKESS
jgi:thiol-disulfide isomerase/thioredoxin